MYGYVNPHIRYSVGEWRNVARLLVFLEKINILPIIVGGTGLYFSSLLGEIAEIPNISKEIRSKWLKVKDENDTHYLHEYLKKIDPKSYKRSIQMIHREFYVPLKFMHTRQTGGNSRLARKSGCSTHRKVKVKICYLPNKGGSASNIENRTAQMLSSRELYKRG